MSVITENPNRANGGGLSLKNNRTRNRHTLYKEDYLPLRAVLHNMKSDILSQGDANIGWSA